MRFIGRSIQVKLLIFFGALALSPVLFLGLTSLYLINQSHSRDVSNLEVQLINQKSADIQKFFIDSLGALTQAVAEEPHSNLENVLDGFLANSPVFESAYVADVSGVQIAGVTHLDESGQRMQENISFLHEVLGGKYHVSPVRYTKEGPLIRLTGPLYTEGRVSGVVFGDINLEKSAALRSLESVRLGLSGYMFLLDSHGRLIAQGNHSGTSNDDIGTSYVNNERVRQVLVGNSFSGIDSSDRYDSFLSNTAVIGAAAPIPEIGWALFTEWPASDADIVIRAIRNQMIAVLIAGIILVVVLAPFLAGRIVKPIHELEDDAAEIAQGNFGNRVAITTGDELEELGSAFNKMAEGLKRLEELRKEFVFIAAHELRTPVTATKWSLSLILDGTLGAVPDALRETLDKIKSANDRLVQLVNDILEIARNDAGRLKIQVAPNDMAESIRAIISEAEPLAKQRNIKILYEAFPDAPRVLMDPDRVKEVVMNFISNAIKYGKQDGSVKIYHELSGGLFTTHVEDDGLGMSEEDQKHVFEKFFRSDSKEVKEAVGTGLGLFITRELVEKMQGTVAFRSTLGKGSRFSFSLPVARPAA